MGELFKRDAEIYRRFFKEQAKLLGIHVQYRYPVNMDYSLHGTDSPLGYSEPIELNIIFDQSPKLKTLKKLGWISEASNDKPYLCQVPYDTPNLQEGSLIEFDVPEPLTGAKVFRITDITIDQILPDSYYCKLVPKMEKQNVLTSDDYKEKSYTYLKVDNSAV